MKLSDVNLSEFYKTKSGFYRNKTGKYGIGGSCIQCGETVFKQPQSTGQFCNKSCKAKYQDIHDPVLPHTTGKDHPSYGCKRPDAIIRMRLHNPNPRTRPLSERDNSKKLHYRTAIYHSWRRSVFERDNFTCVLCEKRGSHLESHHIKRYSLYPDIRFDINNGITLCLRCHRNIRFREEEYIPIFTNIVESKTISM